MKKLSLIMGLLVFVFTDLCFTKDPWLSHQQTGLRQDAAHPVLLPGSFVVFQNQAFVIDTKAADVKVFKTDGSFVSVFGRSGPGPGEFVMPRFSALCQNQLLIKDSRRRQLVTYDLSQVQPKLLRSELDMMGANAFARINDDLMLMGGLTYHDNELCSLVTYDWKSEKVRDRLVLIRDWIGVSSTPEIVKKISTEGISPLAYFDLDDQYIFLTPAAQPTVFRIERSTNKRIQFGERSKRFLCFSGDKKLMERLSSDQTGNSHHAWLELFSKISQVYQLFILNDNRLCLVYSYYNTQRDALDMYLQVYDFSGKLLGEDLLLNAKADNHEAIVFYYQNDQSLLWVLDTDESDAEGSSINTLHSYCFDSEKVSGT